MYGAAGNVKAQKLQNWHKCAEDTIEQIILNWHQCNLYDGIAIFRFLPTSPCMSWGFFPLS